MAHRIVHVCHIVKSATTGSFVTRQPLRLVDDNVHMMGSMLLLFVREARDQNKIHFNSYALVLVMAHRIVHVCHILLSTQLPLEVVTRQRLRLLDDMLPYARDQNTILFGLRG